MKILVVDDNIDSIDMMTLMLKSKNYDVNAASNGHEALEKLRSEKYDLIISDILMPVMDGFQLCRECKKDVQLSKICFIFYTATYIDDKDEAFAFSLGAQKFIRKPIEPENFLNIIKETIEISETQKNDPILYIEQDEKEIFKLYSERLVAKLEKKNLELENEIASRIKTENKLKESEERFRNLFQNNLSVMLLIDPDTGQIADANQSAENYYGWSHQQLTSMRIQDINTLNQGALAEMEKVRSQKQVHFEFRHRLANGSIRNVEVFSSKINILGKKLLHSIIHDITERKRVEEALQENACRLASIYDTVGDVIYHLAVEADGNYRFVSINKAFCNVTGLSEEMIIGKLVNEVIPEPSLSMVLGKYRQAIEENSIIRWEETSDYPTGQLTGDVSIAPVVDNKGRCTHLVGSVHDITKRKQAEDALRESEKKLREAQEMAHLGFWYWDVKTGDVEWSEEVYKIFRLDLKKFTPQIDSIQALSPWPEDHQRDKELIDRAIKSHNPGFYEQKFLRPDQSIGYYYSTFQGNYDENDDLISIIGTVLDITERKQAEESIQKLNTELEQRVIQRTAELEAANKELEAFSYSISHDLRAPLRAIDGFIGILLEDYSEKLDEEGKRVCTVIHDKAKIMGQLIDDLLSFSRLSLTGLQISLIDMKTMAKSIFFELTTPEVRQRIDFQLSDLTPASGDQAMIHQVWVNLISNAIKFSSKRERTVISIKQEQKENKIIYCITDNGAGFDMKYIHKLFGVFQRLHSSQEYEGTGVGLAIVQRIIHRHGGTVWAEGEVDKGASFYFSLPT